MNIVMKERVKFQSGDLQSASGVHLNIGLDGRKPVVGGLRTTQAQTSLCIRAV